METENATELNKGNPFPFNNLFLIKGFVTGKNTLWLYVLGVFSALLGYFVFQFIMMVPLLNAAAKMGITMPVILKNPNILFNPVAIGINKSVLLALMMGMFVFSLLFFCVAIKNFQHKTIASVITGFEKIRWKRYLFSFTVWGILMIVYTVIAYLVSPSDLEVRFKFSNFVTLFIVLIIFIPIQTATEEILFRGYLMQGFGQAFKNGIAPLIITSVLFGLMHGSNPEAKAHGLLIMMPYYILFGVFLGILTLLDEGAELAMGIHCANNLFSGLLITSKNSVLQTDAIFYSTTENPEAELISWFVMAALCFFILYKKYKLKKFKLLLK